MNKRQTGFTLIEIAIVLVIIGLILGGALKGQELIATAKVRSTINQIDGVKAAYYAFQDRYRALPGDYNRAEDNLPNPGAGVTITNGTGNGIISTATERGQVWAQLGVAGFLLGEFDGSNTTSTYDCVSTTCLRNPFSGAMHVVFSSQAAGTTGNSHELIVGRRLPVGIVAEIDRKIDDGLPDSGSFRGSDNGAFSSCVSSGTWDVDAASPSTDCVGVITGL